MRSASGWPINCVPISRSNSISDYTQWVRFETFVWFYLVLIFAGPLILEAQGFYDRPILGSRGATLWALFWGCLFTSMGLIIALYFFGRSASRAGADLVRAHQFRAAVSQGGTAPAGLQEQGGPGPIPTPLHPRRHARGNRAAARRIAGASGDQCEDRGRTRLEPDVARPLVDLLHDHSVNGVILERPAHLL